jgi:hypothetical protein
MPGREEVPEEAVEALAKRRWERDQSAGPFAALGPTWEELQHKPGGPERREKYLVPPRRDLEAVADLIRNQERQRIQEALAKAFETHARWAQEDAEFHRAHGRVTAIPLAGERERLYRSLPRCISEILDGKEPLLAALDTPDPSGEQGESDDLQATLDDMASAIGQAPFIGPNQGREPDEAAYERVKALREREPGIAPFPATDPSKEVQGDGE